MKNYTTVQGKAAIVTGAATGIGRECAFHLAHAGAAVTVDYAGKPDKAEEVVRQIEKDGGRAVNLTGLWICSQAAAKQTVHQGGGGRIINISSVHEDLPMPTHSPYCASKGGLRMRTLAVELAPHKTTVNNIGPGAIDTPLDKPTEDDHEDFKTLPGETPLGRMGRPEEVAGLAVFLASEATAHMTGSTYFIDGGMFRQSGSL